MRSAEHYDVLTSRDGLIEVQRLLGQLGPAEAEALALIAVLIQTVPAEHPRLASARLRLARVLAQKGETDRARSLAEAARSRLVQAFGKDSPRLLLADYVLAVTDHSAGDDAATLSRLEGAFVTVERTGLATAPLVIDLWTLKANAHERRREWLEAAEARAATLRLLEGRASADVVAARLDALARAWEAAGRPDDARRARERAAAARQSQRNVEGVDAAQ